MEITAISGTALRGQYIVLTMTIIIAAGAGTAQDMTETIAGAGPALYGHKLQMTSMTPTAAEITTAQNIMGMCAISGHAKDGQ